MVKIECGQDLGDGESSADMAALALIYHPEDMRTIIPGAKGKIPNHLRCVSSSVWIRHMRKAVDALVHFILVSQAQWSRAFNGVEPELQEPWRTWIRSNCRGHP